jgi:hypothetical protein
MAKGIQAGPGAARQLLPATGEVAVEVAGGER